MGKFKIGDTVIGNDMAGVKYTITGKGFIGTVTDDANSFGEIEINGKWRVKEYCFDIYNDNDTLCEMERYIINEGATIIFWNDKTKTISKRDKKDKFDKELGFLYAYFYKKCGYNKTSRKNIISCIKEDMIKTFLFEFFVKDSGKTKEKARKYLSNLKVD